MDLKDVIVILGIFFIASLALSPSYIKGKGVFFGQIYQAIANFFQLSKGMAILSISPVDLVDYETHLKSKAWWLTVVQSDFSDYVVGEISADKITGKDGEKAKNGLKITMEVNQMTCEYPIRADDIIYRAEWKRFDLDWWECLRLDYSAKLKQCDGWIKKTPYAYGYKTWTRCKVWCLKLTPEAWHGELGDPITHFKSTIYISVNGDTEKATINTKKQTEFISENNLVYGRFVGYLSTKESCPVRNVPDAMHKDNKWRLIDPDSYRHYREKLTNAESCWATVESDETAKMCVNEINNALDSIQPAELRTPSGHYAQPTGGLNDGKAILELEKLIRLPMINMYVRADWLGVVMPKGKPKIVSVESQPFDPRRGNGIITVEVQNVGNARGSFGVYAVCPNPFSTSGTEYITLDPQEKGTVKITLYATPSNKKQEAYCKVYAYDKADPNVKDSATVKVIANPLISCPEGAKRCNGKVIEICHNNNWQPYRTCEYKCDPYPEPHCVEAPPPWREEECAWWDIPCHIRKAIRGLVDAIKTILIWIGGIVLIILIAKWIIIPKVKEKYQEIRRKYGQ